MVGAEGLAARILANVAIWAWLLWGFAFLTAYKDWSMGGEMAWLTLGKPFHSLCCDICSYVLFSFFVANVKIWGGESPCNPSTHYQNCGSAVDLCICDYGVIGLGHFGSGRAGGFGEGMEFPEEG